MNPNIDFATTPFKVQRELASWERPHASLDGRPPIEQPRIAGISAFGAGGSNAHVIVEEYVALAREAVPVQPVIVVLSARSEERLQEQARRLLEHLDTHAMQDDELTDIAYTLQVGREPFDARLACVVGSVATLRSVLRACVEGKDDIEGLYRGDRRKGKEALRWLTGDDDAAALPQQWLAKGKLDRIAELWVTGFDVPWESLHGEPRPRRKSLPTYAFARDRHWFPDFQPAIGAASAEIVVRLKESFNELLYSQVLDELGDGRISVADAVNRTESR